MSAEFSLNPFDPAFQADPLPVYARGRREHPVFRHAGLPMVSVFRHADVTSVLRDSAAWSVGPPPNAPDRFGDAEREPSMLGSDPPVHTRLRGLVNQAFTPRRVRALEPRLREIATELLDAALAQRRVDLVAAYTSPLTVVMIAELIGVPAADREQFRAWSNVVAENLGEGIAGTELDPERAQRQQRANDEMSAYFAELAEERRREPREDLLSALVRAAFGEDKLSRGELDAMLSLLLVAGNETTTNLIGNSVLQLHAHPDELARVRSHPSLVPSAIEEVLRYDSPVQATFRRPLEPIEIGGEKISTDDAVLTWLGSANHDEAVFDAPERFDVTRQPKVQILSFGFGIHYCLGANLARLEGRVALEQLIARTSDVRIEPDGVERRTGFILRGPARLDVELAPA